MTTKSQTKRPVEPTDETPSEKASKETEKKSSSGDGKFVEHIPQEGFGARVITKADWGTLGIEAETSEWNVFNRFKLPVEQFNEEQLNYLLEVDDGFELV